MIRLLGELAFSLTEATNKGVVQRNQTRGTRCKQATGPAIYEFCYHYYRT